MKGSITGKIGGLPDNTSNIKIIKRNCKPLFVQDNGISMIYERGELIILDNNRVVSRIPVPISPQKKLFARLRPFERALRLVPRGVQFINDDLFLLAYNGVIYRGSIKKSVLEVEHHFRSEMNSPLELENISGLIGFDDCVAYGEYFSNPNMLPVAIYTREKRPNSRWEKRFEFESGKINHIHAIIQDNYRKGLIVLTGDNNQGSNIWLLQDNFQTIRCLAGGSQIYRACIAIPTKQGIIYATDTPLERNALYILKDNGDVWVEEKFGNLPGPVVYSNNCRGQFIFSTTVEPDSRLSYFRKLFSIKPGPGIQDDCSHVICLNGEKIDELLKVRKDILPMGIFQFGSIQFPIQNTEVLQAYVVGLKDYDGCWVEIGRVMI